MTECVLTLIAPMQLEDALVDWLLDYDPDMLFTSQALDFHGVAHDELDTAEQVTGRQRRLAIQLQVSHETARDVRSRLAAAFRRAGLRYWISPVVESGVLGRTMAARLPV